MVDSRNFPNLLYQELHNCLDSFFRPCQERVFKAIEKQSCGCIIFSVAAPFILLALLIPCIIIYMTRPPTVAYLFVEGFSKTNFSICPNKGMDIKLLILVASSPGNFEKRLAIRRSWGSYATQQDVAIAFVLGQPLGINTEVVEIEDKLYHDIIITNNLDIYQYLTLKTLAMLKWTQKYCSEAKYLMKADDDLFLNAPAWLAIADDNEPMTIYSHNLRYHNSLCRDKRSKHYVPESEFVGSIPTYATGCAYMMTRDCIDPLLTASFRAKYLRLEDVFLTGLMAQEAGISLREVYSVNGSDSFVKFAVHGVATTKDQFLMWKFFKLLKGEVRALKHVETVSLDAFFALED